MGILWTIAKLVYRLIRMMLTCLVCIIKLFGFYRVVKANSDNRLHEAVRFNNKTITRQLIKLGYSIDRFGDDGKTPLMIAVAFRSINCIKVLLKAGAHMDIVGSHGKSALQMVYESVPLDQKIIYAFHDRLKRQTSSIEELIDKVINANGNFCHVVFFKDIEILKSMLRRGIDINSKGPSQLTALHIATQMSDINLVKWLTSNGANVNAINDKRIVALHEAVRIGNKEIVKNLLKHGADPNIKEPLFGSTPLFEALGFVKKRFEYMECIEILLDYGAIPQSPTRVNFFSIFDFLLDRKEVEIIEMLVGHLAILERSDETIPESVLYCHNFASRVHLEAFRRVENDYKRYKETLPMVVWKNLTLFDLLTESDKKIKIYMIRMEGFLSNIEHFCTKYKLDESFPYYYKKLMKSIARADCLRKLENSAISVVCKLMNGNYNQCYVAARRVVDYLDKEDLVQLCQMEN